MIVVDNLKKEYGSQVLFENVSFKVNPKEKIGIVGRNGHGKTTLLRILTGEEEADAGKVLIPKNYKIGYIKQNILFTKDTVLDEGLLGLPEHQRHETWKLEKVLFGLGFNEAMLKQNPKEISGGFQVRLNLAKTLVSDPDMLLLDEPNNYLDILSIRWLSKFLKNWSGELILITHDRNFMDSIITHTVGIHRKTAKKIKGKTDKYYKQIAYEEETYEKTRINEEKKIKEIENFIQKFRAKARQANLVQSRLKTLSKLETKKQLSQINKLNFNFTYYDTPAKVLLQVKNLAFAYEPKSKLIHNFNITVEKNDRICVIGKNGKGKTTLLKLLTGNLEPQEGSITQHHLTKIAYYEQTNVSILDPNKTVLEEIASDIPNIESQKVRDIAGAMMFNGNNALKKISVLSGGEKARVLLAKIIAKPVNILVLDEPTNHLDIESIEALIKAIKKFKGAVIIVTHNEELIHSVAKRLIVFRNNGILHFDGTYKDFLAKNLWDESTDTIHKKEIKTTISNKERQKTKQELREKLKPIKRNIRLTEEKITSLEQELNNLNNKLIDTITNSQKKEIAIVSKEIYSTKARLDNLYKDLELLYIEQDELEKLHKSIFQ